MSICHQHRHHELQRVLKEDAGLQLNIAKTTVLPEGVSQRAVFDAAHGIINTSPALGHLSGDVVFWPLSVLKVSLVMVLSTISFSGFAKPPDSNILIPISYSIIDALCNSNMLIAQSLTRS